MTAPEPPEAIIAEAMVSAGAPLMHSRVEEAVALKGVYLKKRALKITRKNGDIEYVEVPAEAMSTCQAVDYWHLAGTTYRLACELPAGHDNGGNEHLGTPVVVES